MIEDLRRWGPTLVSAAAVIRFSLERTHSQLIGDKFAVLPGTPVSPEGAPPVPTEAEAQARRLKRAMGGKSHSAVAKLAGVDKSTVTHALSGKNPLAGKLLAWVEGQEAGANGGAT
jgi:hypothetical protein